VVPADADALDVPDWWLAAGVRGSSTDWAEYLHVLYYLAGLMWSAGAGDQAVAALLQAAKAVAAPVAAPPDDDNRKPGEFVPVS
jgi:hypothetical protein